MISMNPKRLLMIVAHYFASVLTVWPASTLAVGVICDLLNALPQSVFRTISLSDDDIGG
jgi:hypothetical protein